MRRCALEWPTRGSPTATLAVLTVATATWAQQWRCRWTGGGREGAHRALAALRRDAQRRPSLSSLPTHTEQQRRGQHSSASHGDGPCSQRVLRRH